MSNMSDRSTDRTAVLANGAEVPLERAAAVLGRLNSYLHHPDTEWEVVYHLRELCLGREIAPEQARTLAQEGWLAADGLLDPDVRAVVLAAVHGEGRVLHLSSPFTDADDRAIAEFVIARDHIRCMLPEDQAGRLLAADPLPGAVRQALREQHAPSPDESSQVQEIMRRLGLKQTGAESPPPQDLPPK